MDKAIPDYGSVSPDAPCTACGATPNPNEDGTWTHACPPAPARAATKVVNIRHEKCDRYIGRARPGHDGYHGNPYHVEPHGREVAISMFKTYFERRLKGDPEFHKRTLALRGQKLGCYCKPLPCHGDVIAAWIDSQEP